MEAPKPTINDEIKNKEKTFEITSNKGKKYVISFKNNGTTLLITSIYDDSIRKNFYESFYSLEKIKENKAFYIYDSIDEILSELFPLIDEGKTKINEESNSIILNIELPLQKIKKIDFIMKEKINTLQDNTFISEKKINEKNIFDVKTINVKLYDYLIRKNNKSYIYSQPKNNELNLNKYYGKYYYLILINIDSDSKENNRLLKVTLDSISKNLPSLKKIGINSNDILILLFFQNISSTFIFQNEDFEKEYDINDYIYIELKIKYNDIEYDIIALTKNNTNKIIYNLKMFYNDIIRDIKKNEGFIYTSIIKCGIEIKENSLLNLFLTLNDIKNKGEISIPSIELNSYDLYSNIQKYEYLHFNIYDLNYYDKAYVIPINSYFNIMKINNSLLNAIQNFYMKEIKLNCSLYYHDYFMGIYLKNLLYEVNYISNISVYLNQDNIDYSQLMSNYVLKYSGYYANFFNLYNSFITSYNCYLFQ